MGQDRAGFYSHDRLERLAGAGIHNADRIHPEWQALRVGDLMRTYCPVQRFEPLGSWVIALEPERLLVLRSNAGDWSWTLHLEALEDGRTRLLSRERARADGLKRLFRLLCFEPVHFVMETGALHGIRDRAEAIRSFRAPDSRSTHGRRARDDGRPSEYEPDHCLGGTVRCRHRSRTHRTVKRSTTA
jgi:hypothetical protein